MQEKIKFINSATNLLTQLLSSKLLEDPTVIARPGTLIVIIADKMSVNFS